jgi:diguanylate cyclase (GGDEF)-like protein
MLHIRSPRFRNLLLFVAVLIILAGGASAIEKIAIEHLLYEDAVSSGHNWASYLAQNVGDLDRIVHGDPPSAASVAFFEKAQKVGNVFRYKIFDAQGHLRLVSDEPTAPATDEEDLAEHNEEAAEAIEAGHPIVEVKEGQPPTRPPFYSEAYVPVVVAGRTTAIMEAYVDQTEKRQAFHTTFATAAVALSLFSMLAFCIPAAAWHFRTKEKQRAEERVYFLAHHDAMTALPNRSKFIEKLQEKLLSAETKRLALHFIDIDHFKNVNDTLGHEAGDSLIIATANRLRDISGESDIVGRLGGDEFVLLQHSAEKHEAEAMANRILELFAEPFDLNGHKMAATACVGVGLAPDDGQQPEELLKSADLAMYAAKVEGRNCVRFFVPEMDVELQRRLKLEALLRDATQKESFELHFQPLVNMPNGSLSGFEALLRLRDTDSTFISPAVFVPVAEEMGLISKIGTWVIREACRVAATWPEHLSISVNLSPIQFTGSVPDVVAIALSDAGLKPQRLEVEITESLLLRDTGAVMEELRRLKMLGVAIVMDDFGTGYSSLSYLWRFPFDKIKIDRSFMRALDSTDTNATTIVRTIVGLGRSLHVRVTAEGVENIRQLEFVRNLKCDQVQGLFFGMPVPDTEVASVILSDFHSRRAGSDADSIVVGSHAHNMQTQDNRVA